MKTGTKVGLVGTLGTFGLTFALSQTIAKKKAAILAVAKELPVEESWKAISAAAPAVKGHIESPGVNDLTADTTYSKEKLPAGIPLQHEVRGYADCVNDTGTTISVKVSAWFVDPDNKERAKAEYTLDAAPGKPVHTTTDKIALDKEGTWTLHVRMEPA